MLYKQRIHCLETIAENMTSKTHFCACWRQGILFEMSKCTTSLQAHYEKRAFMNVKTVCAAEIDRLKLQCAPKGTKEISKSTNTTELLVLHKTAIYRNINANTSVLRFEIFMFSPCRVSRPILLDYILQKTKNGGRSKEKGRQKSIGDTS